MNKDNTVGLQPLEKERGFFKRIARAFSRLTTSQYIYLSAAFLLPFTIMLGIYACMEIHPFGNNSVLMLDLQAQYIYYYEEIRNLLTEGGSFLYSWKRTLGGEFMGIIAYYGASLYNFIFAIFPENMTADAMMFINLMKIGSMGLTFGIYIHKTRNPGEMKTLALSCMYALCSYAVVQTLDPMWLDALVYLPLMILGLESLIKERKVLLYIISLSLIIMANYYIGYMVCIFTFIYFVYYYLTNRAELIKKYPPKQGKFLRRATSFYGVRSFTRIALATLVVLMVCMFMLLAAVYSLSFGKNNFQNTNWVFALRFDFLEIFNKMLIGSYDTVRPEGLPMIYSGMLALIGLPMFYMAPSVKPAKKIGATVVLLVLILSFAINPVDLVWHGFNLPNWLNFRYSFVFSFFVISLTADALVDAKNIKIGNIAAVGGVLLALVAIVQNIKYHINPVQTEFSKADEKNLTSILLSVVFIVAYMIVMYLVTNKKLESAGSFMLAALVCVEMFAGGLINLADVTRDVGMVKYDSFVESNGQENYTSYNSAIRRIEHVVDMVTENDKSFYRMESKVYRRNGGENESMAFGFNGIAHSTSTLNANIIRLLSNLGYASQSHWTKYLGGTPLSDSLLGIKYVITKDDLLDEHFYELAYYGAEGYRYVSSASSIYAMKNTKVLPIAYGVSEYTSDLLNEMATPYYPNGSEAQNEIIKALLYGTDYSGKEVYKPIYAYPALEDCTMGTFTQTCPYVDENGEKQTKNVPYKSYTSNGDDPTIKFTFTAPTNGTIFAHFPMDNFGKSCDIYVNGKFICNYSSSQIVDLGEYEKGEKLNVELRLNDVIYFAQESDYYFFYMDYEAVDEALSCFANAAIEIEDYSNTSIEGTINLPEGQELILTTIPYDAGWNCYIDGEKVEGIKVMGALLAIPASAGEHTVELRYMPDLYVIGLAVSTVGVIILIVLIVLEILKKVREKRAREAAACQAAMLAWEEAVAQMSEEEKVPDNGHMEAFIETEKFKLNVSSAPSSEEDKAEKAQKKAEKEKFLNRAAIFFRFVKGKFTKKQK
ncbi:MAG: YfhO family protein [Clostridia bacterium]|nr:YfhO family protein [Clostridia bacterium]